MATNLKGRTSSTPRKIYCVQSSTSMDSKLVWGNKQGKEFDLKLFGCKNGARQHTELVRDKKEPEIISRDFKIFKHHF